MTQEEVEFHIARTELRLAYGPYVQYGDRYGTVTSSDVIISNSNERHKNCQSRGNFFFKVTLNFICMN